MRVLSGRVLDGKVEVGGEVAEGTHVAVLAPDDEAVVLTAAQQTELAAALDEIHRGDFEDALTLLAEIRAQAGR
jgi:hypothetical protein